MVKGGQAPSLRSLPRRRAPSRNDGSRVSLRDWNVAPSNFRMTRTRWQAVRKRRSWRDFWMAGRSS